MKLVHVTYQFQYTDQIEALVREQGSEHYVLHGMVAGMDRDGRHAGSKVFPGNLALIQARVADERLDGLLDALRAFRDEKPAHAHLEATVLLVERML